MQELSPPRLHSLEIHLWEFPLATSESTFANCRELLSEEERIRADKFRFEKHARNYIFAHASLRSILSGYTRIAARDLRFVDSKQGKPRLAQSATDFRFNMSHASNWALVGVTRGREIGVDIEAIRQDVEFDKLAERFFSQQEREALRSFSPEHKARAFFRCWTCKEAFLKAQGVGLSRNLDSFDVDLSSGPARLLATRPDASEAERWRLFELEGPPGYAAAVAVEGSLSALTVFRCDSN